MILNLTDQEVDMVARGLSQLPWGMVDELMKKILFQANNQPTKTQDPVPLEGVQG